MQGATLVRQRIVDIIEDRWDDGAVCAGLILDPVLVPLAGRATRPFQGWRYLLAEGRPARSGEPAGGGWRGGTAAPPLRAVLRELGLL